MGKIHFMALLCVDIDWDLFPHWCEHYSRFGFDDYYVYLHSWKPLNTTQRRSYIEEIRKAGKGHGMDWNASFAVQDGKESYWVSGRYTLLEAHARNLPESDFVVCADSDEIQDMSYRDYYALITDHDMVEGVLTDCFAETLAPVVPSVPLNRQYPNEGNLDDVLNVNRKVYVSRRKIMASRAHEPVLYTGNHETLGTPEKVSKGHRVLHYTYRPSLPWRMVNRPYNTPETILSVCRYFGMLYHPAADECAKLQAQRAREPGWMPGAEVAA